MSPVCPAAADIEVIKRLIAEKPIIYPVALDSRTKVIGARGETFDRYAVGWGDPVILIDRKGKIANIAYPLNLQGRIQALPRRLMKACGRLVFGLILRYNPVISYSRGVT